MGSYFLQLEHTPSFDAVPGSIERPVSEIPPPSSSLAAVGGSTEGASNAVESRANKAPQSSGGKSMTGRWTTGAKEVVPCCLITPRSIYIEEIP